MRKVPRGKVATINTLRESLAGDTKPTIGCRLRSAFRPDCRRGRGRRAAEGKEITPYWRILKSGGEMNAKYPGGLEGQKRRLEAEGHRVGTKGEKFFVENFERALVDL